LPGPRRYFITGTDTDVGKTRVTAGFARALVALGASPTVVKPVQTGLLPGEEGDAQRAARLAGCASREYVRFALPADPWAAALAEGRPFVTVAEIAERLAAERGDLVVEGAGGIAVPFGPGETYGDLAAAAALRTVVVVGLRLGCINHALLTAAYLRARGVEPAGAVLVARWEPVGADYVADVRRALAGHLAIYGEVPYDDDEAASVEYVAALAAKEPA
jgi:dethiobiotin synthase